MASNPDVVLEECACGGRGVNVDAGIGTVEQCRILSLIVAEKGPDWLEPLGLEVEVVQVDRCPSCDEDLREAARNAGAEFGGVVREVDP